MGRELLFQKVTTIQSLELGTESRCRCCDLPRDKFQVRCHLFPPRSCFLIHHPVGLTGDLLYSLHPKQYRSGVLPRGNINLDKSPRFRYNNVKSKKLLGLKYKGIKENLRDTTRYFWGVVLDFSCSTGIKGDRRTSRDKNYLPQMVTSSRGITN